MTSLRERPNTALLVVDVQNDVVANAYHRDEVIANINILIDFTDYGLPPADKVIAHTNMYWTWQAGPGRTATVVETADVDFHAMEQASS